jgi:hypothetical protein
VARFPRRRRPPRPSRLPALQPLRVGRRGTVPLFSLFSLQIISKPHRVRPRKSSVEDALAIRKQQNLALFLLFYAVLVIY